MTNAPKTQRPKDSKAQDPDSVVGASWSWLCTVLGCILLAVTPAWGQPAGSNWQVGDPICGYYQGPGAGGQFGLMTPGVAARLNDEGFNLVWCQSEDDLDAAHAHGHRALLYPQELGDPGAIPGMLDNPELRAGLDAMIERVKNHPAMYAYVIYDEPTAALFPALGRLVAHIRERDPNHLALINLFPTYASAVALGTSGNTETAYREHLRQFVEIVKPDLISWDHYHFKEGTVTKEPYDGGDYFLNMALAREAALYGGIPFANTVQAITIGPSHRIPNGDEARFLAYTTLGYGGQGLFQFTYIATSDPAFAGGVVNVNGTLTPLGQALQEIHPEFVAVGLEVQSLTSLAAYHLGAVPPGAVGLPADAEFTVDPPVPAKQERGILFGYFGANGDPTHVLVVNLDYTREVTTTVVGPGRMEVFDARERKWQKASNRSRVGREPSRRAKVSLMPGGGKLLRLRSRSTR